MARTRTFDPQEQVAGSVAKSATRFPLPQMLQVNEAVKLRA